MSEKFMFKNVITLIVFVFFSTYNFAQDIEPKKTESKILEIRFYELRGTNTVDFALGTSVINGDFQDPLFEIYSHFGYKHFIIPHVNINIGYNKFNLAYKDLFNEGFMSFDLNVEGLLFPHKRFSPYAFVGGGINAANYFTLVDSKVQGGLGLEYIAYDGLGFKLFADYNHVFSDELDGKIFGDADDVYWRIAIGINFYFGGEKKKQKILDKIPSVINSNPIKN